MKTLATYLPAVFLLAFGVLTLFLSTTVILDLVGMREKQGNYVSFVIWVNFFCGLAYVTSAYGFLKQKEWTSKLLGFVFVALVVTFISFYFYVENGGVHKQDTFGALIFRTSITIILFLLAKYTINNKNKRHERN